MLVVHTCITSLETNAKEATEFKDAKNTGCKVLRRAVILLHNQFGDDRAKNKSSGEASGCRKSNSCEC
jgi:hypothetical protein